MQPDSQKIVTSLRNREPQRKKQFSYLMYRVYIYIYIYSPFSLLFDFPLFCFRILCCFELLDFRTFLNYIYTHYVFMYPRVDDDDEDGGGDNVHGDNDLC